MGYTLPFAVKDTTYDEALATLKGALRFGISPSLDPVTAMLEELHDPDKAYRSVQIAGTNGKTSVAAFCRQIFNRVGHRAASMGTLGVRATGPAWTSRSPRRA